MAGARTRGAKPKSEKGPATSILTMRLRPEIYEALRADAERNSRSISAEAERRVIHPEPGAGEVGRMIDLVIAAIEREEGASHRESADVRGQCRAAVEDTLDLLLGPRLDENMTRWLLSRELRRAEIARSGEKESLLGTVLEPELPMPVDELEEKLGSLRRAIKGKQKAAEVHDSLNLEPKT